MSTAWKVDRQTLKKRFIGSIERVRAEKLFRQAYEDNCCPQYGGILPNQRQRLWSRS